MSWLMNRGEQELPFMSILPENSKQQIAVFFKSLDIYIERGETRGELWAQFDEDDSIHHMRSKLARIVQLRQAKLLDDSNSGIQQEFVDQMLDELYDLINYAAFCVRHITGEKPRVKKIDI